MTSHAEHVVALIARFPRLFRGREPELGITTGPGWTRLFTQLFEQIDRALDDSQATLFRVAQVKQKFGGLCVYYRIGKSSAMAIDIVSEDGVTSFRKPPRARSGFPRETIDGFIADAAALARTTCEQCGNPGRLRTGGWLRLLCDSCDVARSSDARDD
jgi:hypothetical protein